MSQAQETRRERFLNRFELIQKMRWAPYSLMRRDSFVEVPRQEPTSSSAVELCRNLRQNVESLQQVQGRLSFLLGEIEYVSQKRERHRKS
ncbi:MAG: hypothetical protein COT74_12275 [Bdellovibrionales bacterium CG10_big_fil_rev_8_21_14_0_10_45_34]|nr:MAG: hypothetical protein COT74_12275 [Bdellovibrionales bacterium CG10_big_fil_rev_8_21_14_0_10_45_34]